MTSIDAVAALCFFFFLFHFIFFLMLGWIVRHTVRLLWMIVREFQRQSNFWHTRAKKEAFLRDMEKQQ